MNDRIIEPVLIRLSEWKEAAKFSRRQLLVLSLLGVLALAGGLAASAREKTQTVAIKRAAPAAVTEKKAIVGGTAEEAGTTKNRKPRKKVYVHVAGDVAEPGVQEVSDGSRVIDAIEAAGGPINGVSLDAVNLAAKVVDGQKILVREGVAPAGPNVEADAAGAGRPININLADTAELENLPGVGPVLADRIVKWREKNGLFTSIPQLKQVSGIGPKKYADLRDQVSIE